MYVESSLSELYVVCMYMSALRLGLMMTLQPPVVISENVARFPVTETLERFLGESYYVCKTLMDAVRYGIPVARLRSYQVCIHKTKTRWTMDNPMSFDTFAEKLLRPCNFSWEELWWLEREGQGSIWRNEEDIELSWASQRPSVVAANAETLNDPNLRWVAALTPAEKTNADLYEVMFPQKAFSLTQSALDRATVSSSKYLQILIHNMGLLFTFRTQPPRWLSASEALTGMGFPALPSQLAAMNPILSTCGFVLTSFNVDSPERKPQHVRSQCGNSDCLMLAAVSVVWSSQCKAA